MHAISDEQPLDTALDKALEKAALQCRLSRMLQCEEEPNMHAVGGLLTAPGPPTVTLKSYLTRSSGG
jgi:hypothetical protein